jgi:hypothetical protein
MHHGKRQGNHDIVKARAVATQKARGFGDKGKAVIAAADYLHARKGGDIAGEQRERAIAYRSKERASGGNHWPTRV